MRATTHDGVCVCARACPLAGLKILSVYMSGSKRMSYDSAGLTTPDIKWLGVRPSDLDKYSVRAAAPGVCVIVCLCVSVSAVSNVCMCCSVHRSQSSAGCR